MRAAPSAGEILGAALRRDGRSRVFRRGEALFTEGDRAERVFLIERGWVLIACTAGGREAVLGLQGRGEVLGELSALDDEPRNATAVALEEVEAVVAPAATITTALEDPRAALDLIHVLVDRLRDADSKRLEFATLDTLGRVAARLLELDERFGHGGADGRGLELPLSQEQIAAWAGASRESTVKALGTLRALGCITTGRRSLVIRDIEGLRRHARPGTG